MFRTIHVFVAAALLVVSLGANGQDFGALLRSVLTDRSPDLNGLVKSIAEITEGSLRDGVEEPTDVGDKVVLYSTQWCGYCKQAVAHMKRNNVPYTERDIEREPGNRTEYNRLGGNGGVPLLVFGRRTMTGFDPSAFDRQYTRFRASMPVLATAAPTASGPLPGDTLFGKIRGVKILASPQRQSTPMLTLAEGEAVIYMGAEQDGFYRVTSTAGEGWVDALLVRWH